MSIDQALDLVRDNPEGRYQMRVAFYKKYGFARDGGAGYGTSELGFLRWEIGRGVLNPLTDTAQPGSPWWRNVNEAFLYSSELAAAIQEGTAPASRATEPVRLWLDYIRSPTRQSWYRAHNGSIVAGYFAQGPSAVAESDAERRFLNMVLYRLLYAQALVEGEAPGVLSWLVRKLSRHAAVLEGLEHLISDPRGPSVDLLVHLPDFYPDHYPLSQTDIEHVFDRGHGLEQDAEALMDRVLISPYLTTLYGLAAKWLLAPRLPALVQNDQPCYPVFSGDLHAQSS
jgi:hypothetical protein